MVNEKIINEFERLLKQIQFDMDHDSSKKNKIKHSFRLQAIKKALEAIRRFPEKITSSKQLKGVKDVGKGTLERIDEILEFGKLGEVMDDILDQTYLNYVQELDELYGIGQAKALEYYQKYGVKSIQDLKDLHASGKITLPDNVLVGLKYYGMAKEKIPRTEMDEIDTYLHSIIPKIDPELFGIICGSYRRLKETSNDIDMLLIHPGIKHVIAKTDTKINYLHEFIIKLKKEGFIVDSLTSDNVKTKYMGLCKFKDNPIRRIDIRFIPYESYYAATLYFTGSADFNRKMRRLADSLGYKLNEYGLYDEDGKMMEANSEKDIFDYLGMEYVSPEKRI
jgi:DNA polymerase beta